MKKEYIERIRNMTQDATHAMFKAEKTSDAKAMDEAAKNYATLCAAVTAMERQMTKATTSRKCGKLVFYCPSCHHYIGDLDKPPHEYCEFCGQKLRPDESERE